MIMNVLWTRLGETGKDWRLVYKVDFLNFLL
jgi:epsin